MKLKHSPGRKNKRRIAAFSRIKMREGPLPKDLQNLADHIMAESTARGIRTKKKRASFRLSGWNS